ncbi:tRNA pseudouridine(13) synthase TruD [Psychrobium sp. MM17-31]|uniref:tRNA pseudouridine(13) synthase TruD n=1 Tax=Psychrobium sp. MM17-31 TaxID=2917758 RepID=UPI001EF5957C|nr:tRNA pseudouridine(13) synthase TruD [Psychrobium sp. MM17-31]MCG7530913.1 tRNA pseudouridine(13) synthase TruD [Psychrobium sp. MM17-31]
MTLPNWRHLHAEPTALGRIKTYNSDFIVIENLGYGPEGSGEHLWLDIEKDGLTTAFAAKLIARWAGVTQREIGYAGKKDRYGVTRQSITVHLPGKDAPNIDALVTPQLRVLNTSRHNKKIKTGALKGNTFELVVRDLQLDDDLEKRLTAIKNSGVPNYFGQQRFGRDGENIERAQSLFTGNKVKNKDVRGMLLSSARSLIFNDVVSARIASGLHTKPIDGDVFMLGGSKASFKPEQNDDVIIKRFNDGDIELSAPMWGKGLNKATDQALELEQQVVDKYELFASGLAQYGLKQERRALLVKLKDMSWQVIDDGLKLNFSLPSGSYATSVLRELAIISDASNSEQMGE